MTSLVWDEVGERTFQTGLDRGVLYLPDKAVAWNGLTGIDEGTTRESQAYYQDGVKYLEHHVLGEFTATLRAFTYPDEFQECVGERDMLTSPGLIVHDQRPQPFGMSYRTKLGNDVSGVDYGYEIHLLYNLYALPDSIAYQSISNQADPIEFSWALGGIPELVTGNSPTVHLSVKTTVASFDSIKLLEDLLYGTRTEVPQLPTPAEVIELLEV